MNQILNTNKKRNKIIKFFKVQLCISIISVIFGIIYLLRIIKIKERENNISNIISLNAKLNSVFSSNKVTEEAKYFGQIICDKIGLDYFIYNNYSEENLKVLPCKFSGGKLDENGNICIIGHNYFDNRFFSNINKLEIGDIITIKDLDEKIYKYEIYKKEEINQNEVQKVLESKNIREITLCTCTLDKQKRFIIKAKGIL